MAELGRVRQNSYEDYSEGQDRFARLNRRGELVVTNFFDQIIMDGRGFHVQIGTEDAPVNTTTSIDDQLAWGVVDNTVGYAMIPLLFEVVFDMVDTAVNLDIMLEWDKDKVRYTSGGTAYVPANMRGDDPRAAVGTFVVGTDVTVAAKSAVPNTVELARRAPVEDVVTDPTTGKIGWDPVIYSCKSRPIVIGIDACSYVLHVGAGTADANAYGVFQFAQLPKESVV